MIIKEVSPGRWLAVVDGVDICRSSQPVLDGARALLARGRSPDEQMEVRRHHGGILAFSCRLGAAAGLTVLEGSGAPRFARWLPDHRNFARGGTAGAS